MVFGIERMKVGNMVNKRISTRLLALVLCLCAPTSLVSCATQASETSNQKRTASLQHQAQQKARANAADVVNDLRHCKKIVVTFFPDRSRVVVLTDRDKKKANMVSEMVKLLADEKAVRGEVALLLITRYYFRLYVSNDIAYEAKMDIEEQYFEVIDKISVHNNKGKETVKLIKLLSIAVTELPTSFANQMKEIMRQVDQDYPKSRKQK